MIKIICFLFSVCLLLSSCEEKEKNMQQMSSYLVEDLEEEEILPPLEKSERPQIQVLPSRIDSF